MQRPAARSTGGTGKSQVEPKHAAFYGAIISTSGHRFNISIMILGSDTIECKGSPKRIVYRWMEEG